MGYLVPVIPVFTRKKFMASRTERLPSTVHAVVFTINSHRDLFFARCIMLTCESKVSTITTAPAIYIIGRSQTSDPQNKHSDLRHVVTLT